MKQFMTLIKKCKDSNFTGFKRTRKLICGISMAWHVSANRQCSVLCTTEKHH